MRITSKGQVTIPQAIRERAGLRPGTDVTFSIDDTGIVRLAASPDGAAPQALSDAVGALRGAGRAGLTTEEILALTRG